MLGLARPIWAKPIAGRLNPTPLPKGFAKVSTGVYTGSGFDRGHLCPSADRADQETNNDPTFYLTNIIPECPT